jgi:hypothetical protein
MDDPGILGSSPSSINNKNVNAGSPFCTVAGRTLIYIPLRVKSAAQIADSNQQMTIDHVVMRKKSAHVPIRGAFLPPVWCNAR